jgi:small conductance mechanosensitive channel
MHYQAIVKQLQEIGVAYGPKILAAILIFVFGIWLAKIFSKITKKAMFRAKMEPTIIVFLNNVIYFGIIAFVILAALSKLGIQTASFIAVLGAAGLAVGLALQGSLSNLASGVLLIFFKSFKVGDFIKVAGVEGTVAAIQVFSTVLITHDRKKIIIPNSKITSDIIINSTIDEEVKQ